MVIDVIGPIYLRRHGLRFRLGKAVTVEASGFEGEAQTPKMKKVYLLGDASKLTKSC